MPIDRRKASSIASFAYCFRMVPILHALGLAVFLVRGRMDNYIGVHWRMFESQQFGFNGYACDVLNRFVRAGPRYFETPRQIATMN